MQYDSARFTSIIRTGLATCSVLALILAGCGGGGGSSASTPVNGGGTPPSSPPAAPALALVAGNLEGAGTANGAGTTARFNAPFGVAADSVGNLYVSDIHSQTIRKITPAGVVSTFAGSPGLVGTADGVGSAARFFNPEGIAVDGAGNVYVADSGNQTIRMISPSGTVSTLAGRPGFGGFLDGTGSAALFTVPCGVAVDIAGNVYVADTYNNAIRKIAPGGVVTTLAGTPFGPMGSADGTGSAARFGNPFGIAVDLGGVVYVADTNNSTIRKVTQAGVVTTIAGQAGVLGSADAVGTNATFRYPFGLNVDASGNIYVADTTNDEIRVIAPGGAVTTLAGSPTTAGSSDGTGAAARFNSPSGLAFDAAGNAYVSDTGNNTVRKVTAGGVVTTLAGVAGTSGSSDGNGAAASFDQVAGIAADASGNLYVADSGNSTIRKITPAGAVTTFAGLAGNTGSQDGTGTGASFMYPSGVAFDHTGNLYVADTLNYAIRVITPAGVVTTLAGNPGFSGAADGNGAAATFNWPRALTVDASGNIYVADTFSDTIRKVTPGGAVTTLAGTAGNAGSSDGSGASASFSNPSGIVVDAAGALYVSDTLNNTIRKISPGGAVSTIAGTAGLMGSADGSGAAARFNAPSGLAIDTAGNLYVADTGNDTIRKITPGGVVSTIAGVAGQGGFVAGSLPGGVYAPIGLTLVGSSLYITSANGVAVVTNVP